MEHAAAPRGPPVAGGTGGNVSIVVVVRSRGRLDDGVVVHVDGYAEALRFAHDWRRRHPRDRVSILSADLDPLAALDAAQRGNAQPGSSASGTLS
jgi:hypothetical protein